MDMLKIVTLNVRGLRGKKRFNILKWFKDNRFDICLVQETYCTEDFVSKFKKGWNGDIIHSFTGSEHSKGVSILHRKDLGCKIVSVHCDTIGRLVLVNMKINNTMCTICNVYCPNNVSDRVQFLTELKAFVQKHSMSKLNLYIGGDLNYVDSLNDRASGALDKSSDSLAKFKKDLCLIDVWRYCNPNDKGFTYVDPTRRGHDSRIDLWLMPKLISNSIQSCTIVQAPAPDHKAVILKVHITERKRGAGYWKMNNSILNDEEYKEGITELYYKALEEYGDHVSHVFLWEFLKLKIKEYTVAYCKMKSKFKSVHNHIKELEKQLDLIDKTKANSLNSDEADSERKLIKQELDSLYEKRATGYYIRSRARWIEDGERSTSYFLGVEKVRQVYNCIHCLKDANGKRHHCDHGILSTAKSFYENLYTCESKSPSDLEDYFKNLPLVNKLDNDAKQKCEGLITYSECEKALSKMKTNKAPGLDGITTEFYKAFWPLLGNLIVHVFNESYELGELSESQRKAVISLIFKKDDQEDISNYRPISLTNVDYHILAFTLAERVQQVIGDLVSTDQSAYIRGRYMGTNIRLVNDIIEYYDLFNKSGILLTLDFTKAFDTLRWDFMFKSLQFFNFGPSFIQWIKALYHKPEARIKNNGYFSEYFNIQRGVRQGCPVSSLMFILCVEVLAIKVRNSSSLQGFRFGYQKPIKLTQYADDGILFLNNRMELGSALNILKKFGKLSGLNLNLGKCEGFWLGKDKALQSYSRYFGIKWPEQLRCLGIYLGYSNQLNDKKNFDEKVDEIEDILNK